MLTQDEFKSNTKRFQEANLKFNIFTKELEEFLGEEFYIAPATSSKDMYGCFPGGLLNHCLRTCKYALAVNNSLPVDMRPEPGTIFRTIFLSQIGRAFLFNMNTTQWQIDKGQMYEFNDDVIKVSLKAGERSLYFANKYGVKLTEEEFQAILMLDSYEKSGKFRSSVLAHIIRISFDLSILEEKNGKK